MNIRLVLLVLIETAAACTTRNKAFCGDGVCIDPSLPYCDVDGSIAGSPNTCIAVECTPGEIAGCRGDVAITCNPTGTNFDDTLCPLGCEPDVGCLACNEDSQCPESSPVCDSTANQCRGCSADDECVSQVCDVGTGTCVSDANILYAAPTDFGSCSLAQPCPLDQAVTLATNSDKLPLIRMLPGTYTIPLVVTNPTAKPLQIVATGATIAVIGDVAAIAISDGADVVIRGIHTTSQRQIQCGASTGAVAALEVQQSTFTAVGQAAQAEIDRCTLRMFDSEMAIGDEDPFVLKTDARLVADRVHIHGSGGPHLIILGNSQRATVEVTNSLLDDVGVFGFIADSSGPGTRLLFAYDTFILRTKTLDICKGNAVPFFSVNFENSIIATLGGFDAIESPNAMRCAFASTLLSRQSTSTAPSGTTVGDPRFVDSTIGDFHLSAESPAVDAAQPGAIAPGLDLDGRPRPQGGAPDLGAYEHVP